LHDLSSYKETFSNSFQNEINYTEADWIAFKGINGQIISNSSSENFHINISPIVGKSLKETNINAGLTLDSLKGFFTSYNAKAVPLMLYTEEYNFDLQDIKINKISWFQGHSSSDFESRIVIRIDDLWYISDEVFKKFYYHR
jgi:hypothetical protein